MLHQLKLHLNSRIEHKCMHKKFGTVLYRNGLGRSGTPPKDLEYMASKSEQTMLSDDVILTKQDI